MKKLLTVTSLLALVALPAWGGGIGLAYSTWDTGDASDDQGMGIKINFDVGRFVDFEIRSTWLDDLTLSSQGNAFRLEAVPVDIGLSTDFLHDGKVHPFIGGGFSFVYLNAHTDSAAVVRTDDEAGWYAVAGLEGNVTERFALYGEVLYRDVSAEFESDGFQNRDFADYGADLSGVGGNVGLMLSW